MGGEAKSKGRKKGNKQGEREAEIAQGEGA